MHILLVGNEADRMLLEPELDAAGYGVTAVSTGRAAIDMAREIEPDLILLDLGLPDCDGRAVIQHVRLISEVPIIVTSTRDAAAEKVAALDDGADDYVAKPFETDELLARLRAAERRIARAAPAASGFISGPLAIDFRRRRVSLHGEPVKLSPKEYALIHALATRPGQPVSHRRLLIAGWGPHATDTQYLRVYVGMLRQKLEEDPSDPQLIITEPGTGYRLKI